jgi:polyribonucleotide nucleotidyltransferase
MEVKVFETKFGGKELKVEISNLANQANGSALVRYGETAVFATAVMSEAGREGLDYFPLTVDYEERFYAAGMILGSRFIRREGRPSDEAVLTSRLIDRTIRPLFNKKTRNEVQVTVLALSVDAKNDPDIPAILAASLALGISDIPWAGPVGAVRIGYQDDKKEFIINPTYEEREKCSLDNVVCGVNGKINMIETAAKEVGEDIVLRSFEKAQEEIKKIEDFQKEIIAKMGKEKRRLETKEISPETERLFKDKISGNLENIIYSQGDLGALKREWLEIAKEELDEKFSVSEAEDLFEEKVNELIHKNIIAPPEGEEKRPDGRKIDQLRSIYASVGFLPILHGSAVFYRGGTHILSVVTLGGPEDVQLIQGMEVQTTKHFMHHYNFPPFSSGETGRMGSPGRREIGHGALAEKALLAVIPPKEEFPYTIRVVSESMASNGSTSQGSICAATLALMDAGVPIKNPVAGIAIGLMMDESARDGNNKYKLLTDIQGPEDHHGDMDFKCAGTKEGVTAIQMDVKVEGITLEILKEALERAKKARMEILDIILKIIPKPRPELSQYAPRIIKIKINPDKIREVIGPGGKIINSIINKTGAQIDIEQDGTIFITAKSRQGGEEAKKIIEDLTHEFEAGEIVTGPVSRLFDFGAMVELGHGQDGLIHISEIAPYRVNKVSDILKVGDVVTAKVIEIDEKGRINLSLKRLDPSHNPNLKITNKPNVRTNYSRREQRKKQGQQS